MKPCKQIAPMIADYRLTWLGNECTINLRGWVGLYLTLGNTRVWFEWILRAVSFLLLGWTTSWSNCRNTSTCATSYCGNPHTILCNKISPVSALYVGKIQCARLFLHPQFISCPARAFHHQSWPRRRVTSLFSCPEQHLVPLVPLSDTTNNQSLHNITKWT